MDQVVAASIAAPKPRFRSTQTRFDVDELVDKTADLARLKRVPWRWCGDHYGKPRRSLGPDRPTLEASSPFLQLLADVAPNGYPNLGCLRAALMKLDDEHGILEDKGGWRNKSQLDSATVAADLWRKMLRDALELKKSRCTIREKQLRKLVETLQPQAPPSQQDAEADEDGKSSDGSITGDISGSITGDEPDSGDDCAIVSFLCGCGCGEFSWNHQDLMAQCALVAKDAGVGTGADALNAPAAPTTSLAATPPSTPTAAPSAPGASDDYVGSGGDSSSRYDERMRTADVRAASKKRQALLVRDSSIASGNMPSVPEPGKIGQRGETVAGKKVRLTSKTTPGRMMMKRSVGTAPVQKKKKPVQKKNKRRQVATAAVDHTVVAASAVGVGTTRVADVFPPGPYRVVHRSKLVQCYIMGPTFVCGISKHRTSCFEEIANDLCEQLTQGRLASKAECADFIEDRISGHHGEDVE